MSNETTNVDHGCDVKMISLIRKEKEFEVVTVISKVSGTPQLMAYEINKTKEYLEKHGNIEFKAFRNTAKDMTKLADFKAKRVAEKATETKREDSDRRF